MYFGMDWLFFIFKMIFYFYVKFCVKNEIKYSEMVQMLVKAVGGYVEGFLSGTNVSKQAVKTLEMTRELDDPAHLPQMKIWKN